MDEQGLRWVVTDDYDIDSGDDVSAVEGDVLVDVEPYEGSEHWSIVTNLWTGERGLFPSNFFEVQVLNAAAFQDASAVRTQAVPRSRARSRKQLQKTKRKDKK